MSHEENNKLVDEFCEWLYKNKRTPRGVIAANSLRAFTDPVRQMSREMQSDLHLLEEPDVNMWLSSVAKRTRKNTVAQYYLSMREFAKYMKEQVGSWNFSVRPASYYLSMVNIKPLERILIRIPNLFEVRRRSVPLLGACVLEMLISSGMRIGELAQLRASDVLFCEIPFDQELQQTSLFCGATIHLHPDLVATKGRRLRTTYISVVAAKLLKQWMDLRSIEIGSNCPLFPLNSRVLCDYLPADILGENKALMRRRSPEVRLPAFLDLNPEDFDDPWMRRQIARSQKRQRRKPKVYQLADADRFKESANEVHRRKLHAHALRHSFTCLMWYRSYAGTSRDFQRVQSMLGHSRTGSDTTMRYLDDIDYIQTPDQWVRVMCGRTADWSNIRLTKSESRHV